MNEKIESFSCLNKIALVPSLELRLVFVLLVVFRLLSLISGHYPNEVSFWLFNCNECMLRWGDVVLFVFAVSWSEYDIRVE